MEHLNNHPFNTFKNINVIYAFALSLSLCVIFENPVQIRKKH